MSDPARYYSLIKRQSAKLAYAPKMVRAFERSVRDLGPNPSFNELARWLNAKKIPPSTKAREDAKWTAQTVRDWLEFDGIEPTDENLRDLTQYISDLNQSGRSARLREFGFRCAAKLRWREVEGTVRFIRGDERCAYDEEILEEHLRRISHTAEALRTALRYHR